jgi:hypothetical protein
MRQQPPELHRQHASTLHHTSATATPRSNDSVTNRHVPVCWIRHAYSGLGAGTIVGAWVSRKVRQDREARWLVGFSTLMALTCLGVALSPWFWLITTWIIVFGLADGPTQSSNRTCCKDAHQITSGDESWAPGRPSCKLPS